MQTHDSGIGVIFYVYIYNYIDMINAIKSNIHIYIYIYLITLVCSWITTHFQSWAFIASSVIPENDGSKRLCSSPHWHYGLWTFSTDPPWANAHEARFPLTQGVHESAWLCAESLPGEGNHVGRVRKSQGWQGYLSIWQIDWCFTYRWCNISKFYLDIFDDHEI